METKRTSFTTKANREEQMLTAFFALKNATTIGHTYRVEFKEDEYSRYDAIIYRDEKPVCVAEIKVRDKYSYSKIESWGGSFLELTKIVGVAQQLKEENIDLPLVYFNFYSDIAIAYNVSLRIEQHNWELKLLQQNDYDKNEVWKHVTKLQNDNIRDKVSLTEINKYK